MKEEWKPLTKADYMKRPAYEEIVEFYQNPDGKPVTEIYHHKPNENLECEYCPNKVFPNQDSVGYELYWDNDPMEIICEHCYHELKLRKDY